MSVEALQAMIQRTLLPQSSFRYSPIPTEFGCTAVAAMNPDDHPLLGHNYDLVRDDRAALVVHTAVPGKYASVGIADMGYLGMNKGDFLVSPKGQEALLYSPFMVVDGVNEKGFSIATLYVPGYSNPVDNGMTKIFSMLIPRYMLDNARSVQDALEKFQQLDVKMMGADKNYAYHWLLNDAYGDSAVVEFVNNAFTSLPKAFTVKHQTTANYWITPAIELKGENGFDRVKMVEKNFKKTKYPTDVQLMEWLSNVVPKKDKEIAKMAMVNDVFTNWTVIYDLKKCSGAVYMREDFVNRINFGLRR